MFKCEIAVKCDRTLTLLEIYFLFFSTTLRYNILTIDTAGETLCDNVAKTFEMLSLAAS